MVLSRYDRAGLWCFRYHVVGGTTVHHTVRAITTFSATMRRTIGWKFDLEEGGGVRRFPSLIQRCDAAAFRRCTTPIKEGIELPNLVSKNRSRFLLSASDSRFNRSTLYAWSRSSARIASAIETWPVTPNLVATGGETDGPIASLYKPAALGSGTALNVGVRVS